MPLVTTDTSSLQEIGGKQMLLNVDLQGQRSVGWLTDNAQALESLINLNGIVVVRGLSLMTSKQFGQSLAAIFDEALADYAYRSTPRTALRGQVYTASEYHSDMTILQHNESSYSNQWAMRVGFFCQQSATFGGRTPVADSRRVYFQIPFDIRAEFEAKQIRYVRNYGLIDLPWQEVFQTTQKEEVEAFCAQNGLSFEWSEQGLKTTQINPAVARHPQSGEKVWFNQAHLFHVSALPSNVRQNLSRLYAPDELPRHCYFGDGSPIPDDMLEEIRAVYERESISFDWQRNDLMLLDNMLFSHGRTPFTGERKVLVGMTRKADWHGCAVT